MPLDAEHLEATEREAAEAEAEVVGRRQRALDALRGDVERKRREVEALRQALSSQETRARDARSSLHRQQARLELDEATESLELPSPLEPLPWALARPLLWFLVGLSLPLSGRWGLPCFVLPVVFIAARATRVR